MTKREQTSADHLRAALKAAGYTARQVTVKRTASTLHSALDVKIRDLSIPKSKIEEIANRFEVVRRDEKTGEILGGGNRFVDVEYDRDALKAHAATLIPFVMEAKTGVEFTIPGFESLRLVKLEDTRTPWNSVLRTVDTIHGEWDYLSAWFDIRSKSADDYVGCCSRLTEVLIEAAHRAKEAAKPEIKLYSFGGVAANDVGAAVQSSGQTPCQLEDWALGM